MRLVVGIDIGWAEDRKTLGVATSSDVLPASWNPTPYADERKVGRAWSAKTSLPDLVHWVDEIRGGGRLQSAVVVLDGPLSHVGPPSTGENRWIDGQCQCGDFQGRCVAGPLNGGGGPLFVAATYVVAFAATNKLRGKPYRMRPWIDPDVKGAQVFETNPTVGLGVAVPMFPPAKLPSHKHPLRHTSGETCRDKSDWYWLEGGGRRVAEVIGSVEVAGCGCHEQRAALYCLALGVQIRDKPDDATWMGDPKNGIYNLLGPVHRDWKDAVARCVRQVPAEPQPAPEPVGVIEMLVNPLGLATCDDPNCLLHGRPITPKTCPYCSDFNRPNWAGIDGHSKACRGWPDNMTHSQFKDRICQQHWPRRKHVVQPIRP